MGLKSKNYLPPNGFVFHEALTGWTSPNWLGFDDTVRALIAHRAANRGRFAAEKMDFAQVSVEVEQQVEARLRQTYGAKSSQWLTEAAGESPPNFPWPNLRPQLKVGDVGAAEKVKSGVGLILDFLGPTLRAVPHDLAEKRAVLCVTCPQNKPGNPIIHAGGDVLKKLLQAKSDLKLYTSHDSKLEDCAACDCNLKLKPHVELAYVLSRTTKEIEAKLDPRCWILKRDQF